MGGPNSIYCGNGSYIGCPCPDFTQNAEEPELKGAKALLKEDAPLQELARTPLVLSIMTLAYRGLTVDQLEHLDSLEARRQHLFATYVARMFERRGLRGLYPAD